MHGQMDSSDAFQADGWASLRRHAVASEANTVGSQMHFVAIAEDSRMAVAAECRSTAEGRNYSAAEQVDSKLDTMSIAGTVEAREKPRTAVVESIALSKSNDHTDEVSLLL